MNERHYFNSKAGQWDSLMPADERARVEGLIAALGLQRNSRVLDVGCGTGIIIPALRRQVGAYGHVVAIDIAEQMLVRAHEKLPSERECVAADVHALPFTNQSFDAVVCFNCFPHFHDKPRAFLQMQQLLRQGGALYICHSRSREGINALHSGLSGVVQKDRIPPDAAMRELFANAGFQDIDICNAAESYRAQGYKPC